MLSLSSSFRYFLYRHPADMRKGFDGLIGLVRVGLMNDPLRGDVFIFFNKRRSQVKLFLWKRDGFSMYYKRLEQGTYELPRTTSKELKSSELMLILQGISLKSVRRRKRFDLNEDKFDSSSQNRL